MNKMFTFNTNQVLST